MARIITNGAAVVALCVLTACSSTRTEVMPPTVNVSTGVTVNVSAANVNKSVTIRRRYGTTGGSRGHEKGLC